MAILFRDSSCGRQADPTPIGADMLGEIEAGL